MIMKRRDFLQAAASLVAAPAVAKSRIVRDPQDVFKVWLLEMNRPPGKTLQTSDMMFDGDVQNPKSNQVLVGTATFEELRRGVYTGIYVGRGRIGGRRWQATSKFPKPFITLEGDSCTLTYRIVMPPIDIMDRMNRNLSLHQLGVR